MASPEIEKSQGWNPVEELHLRDEWRKNGLGSDPRSQDEPGKN